MAEYRGPSWDDLKASRQQDTWVELSPTDGGAKVLFRVTRLWEHRLGRGFDVLGNTLGSSELLRLRANPSPGGTSSEPTTYVSW